jgi:hypothetical protein
MTIDLDDIESRISDGIYGDGQRCDSVLVREDAFFALAEIIAEVERLRGEADLLRTGREAARSYADRVEAEVVTLRGERAAVVAWLRYEAELRTGTNTAAAFRVSEGLSGAADDIERGEHRREED